MGHERDDMLAYSRTGLRTIGCLLLPAVLLHLSVQFYYLNGQSEEPVKYQVQAGEPLEIHGQSGDSVEDDNNQEGLAESGVEKGVGIPEGVEKGIPEGVEGKESLLNRRNYG